MSTYKLIQDIEAEDHILGPLSLRQFIFALFAALFYYLCVVTFLKGLVFMLVIFLPPALLLTFFAFPFGKDQPTEVWALAKIRFLFKPRKRIWNQSGVKELVTVTAPKRVERHLTDGLSQSEIRSRLQALSNTIDSRGMAIQNAGLGAFVQPGPLDGIVSDRLVQPAAVPNPMADLQVPDSEDVMDEVNNPIARQFDQMIQKSSQDRRQQLMSQMSNPLPAPVPTPSSSNGGGKQWFTGKPSKHQSNQDDQDEPERPAEQVIDQILQPASAVPQAQEATAEEEAIAARVKEFHESQHINSRMKTIEPLGSKRAPEAAKKKAEKQDKKDDAAAVTPAPDPAILALANNNDLNVATLARQAKKATEGPDGEVVISLH